MVCTDGTDEAGFILIGQTAQQLIGATALHVVGNNQPDNEPVNNVYHAASQMIFPPKEFKSLCSMRFKFVVHVTSDSFKSRHPTFHVQQIKDYIILKPHLSSLDVAIPGVY